jgi:hypothetical protein
LTAFAAAAAAFDSAAALAAASLAAATSFALAASAACQSVISKHWRNIHKVGNGTQFTYFLFGNLLGSHILGCLDSSSLFRGKFRGSL